MGLVFYDVNNEDEIVTTWEAPYLVVSFKVKDVTSYSRKTYFGFDSVKLNGDGKITHIHDIALGKITHLYNDGVDYEPIAGNEPKRDSFLEKEFKIFSAGSGSNIKYSAQAWVHLPGLNMTVDNLEMKLEGNYRNVPLTFVIPQGIVLKYKFANSWTQIENDTPVTFTGSSVQISVEAADAVGEVEIIVKNRGEQIIGSLGIYAYQQIALNVYLWAVVENPNGSKTADQINRARQSLMYSESEQGALKEKLDKVYHQAGVNITLHDAGTIEYDPNSANYNAFVASKNIDSNQKCEDFFDALIKYNTEMERKIGTNLMITDASCTYPAEGVGTRSLSGLGRIGNKYAIVFNQSRTDYGVCSHEIGHTLGLIHSFYEQDLTIDVLRKITKEKNLLIGMIQRGKKEAALGNVIGNEPPDMDDYLNANPADKERYQPIREKRDRTNEEQKIYYDIIGNYYEWKGLKDVEIDKNSQELACLIVEPLLFMRQDTKNLMDYNENNYDFMFKWQWKKVYNKSNMYK